MFDVASVGHSYLGVTMDNTPVLLSEIRTDCYTLHQQHLDRIDVCDSVPEEVQGGVHMLQWCVKDETLALKGCEDQTNSQRLTRSDEQSRADEKSSQGLTRQDAFKGQRVVA